MFDNGMATDAVRASNKGHLASGHNIAGFVAHFEMTVCPQVDDSFQFIWRRIVYLYLACLLLIET